MSLRVSVRKVYFAWKKNNNKMLITKIARKILGIHFNYALSIIFPDNHVLFKKHFVSRILLHESEECVDQVLDHELKLRNIPQWYSEEYLIEVSDVLVDAASGIAFVNGGDPFAILESSNILAIEVSDYMRPRSPKKIEEGKWGVLSSRSFAHWLLQDVPRFLRLLEQCQSLQIATSNDAPTYVEDMLLMCGITPTLRVPVLRAANFNFVSAQYAVGNPSLRDIQTLRTFQDTQVNTYWREQKLVNNHRAKKIYISRRFSNRPLPNEEYLEEKALSAGFDVVYLERISLPEQIMMFENVEVICGALGAGLANLVWTRNCRIVFEIYNDVFAHQASSMLAKRLNISYFRVNYVDALDAHEIWSA